MMKVPCAFSVCAIGAALLVGCGGGDEDATAGKIPERPPKLKVALDGRPGPENVGILVAEQRGFFEDAGLDVWVGSPLLPGRPVSYVAVGMDSLGVAQQPQLVFEKDRGSSVVAVGNVIEKPTEAMIWLKKSDIDGIADLKGKTIAIPGVAFQKGVLRSVLHRAGLKLSDVDIKHVGFEMVSALLDGRADAIFGGSWNVEGAALEARGAEPVIRRVQALGIPDYEELVLIARPEFLEKHPDLIRSFIAAVARGTAVAIKDPETAVRVIEEHGVMRPEATPQTTRAEVEATLPLLSRNGRMDSAQVDAFVNWMHMQGLIQSEPSVAGLLTDEFLEAP